MPARVFEYFDDWRNEILVCPSCGWRGTFEEGLREYWEAVVDSSCPNCPESPMLAVVSATYSVDEYLENRATLSPEEQACGDTQVGAIRTRS